MDQVISGWNLDDARGIDGKKIGGNVKMDDPFYLRYSPSQQTEDYYFPVTAGKHYYLDSFGRSKKADTELGKLLGPFCDLVMQHPDVLTDAKHPIGKCFLKLPSDVAAVISTLITARPDAPEKIGDRMMYKPRVNTGGLAQLMIKQAHGNVPEQTTPAGEYRLVPRRDLDWTIHFFNQVAHQVKCDNAEGVKYPLDTRYIPLTNIAEKFGHGVKNGVASAPTPKSQPKP